jgi:hypothetical protein
MQRAWYQICAAANLAFVRLDAPRLDQSQRAESAASVFCLERNVRTAQHPQCAVMQLLCSYATPNRRSLPMQQNKSSFKTPTPTPLPLPFFYGLWSFCFLPNWPLGLGHTALCALLLLPAAALASVLCTLYYYTRIPCYCYYALHAKPAGQCKPKPATHWPLATGHWPLATGGWWLVGLVLVLVRDHGAAGGWWVASGHSLSSLGHYWPSMALSVTPSVVRWCRSWPL